MAHDDHFHCFDHSGASSLFTRTDTYLRAAGGAAGIQFYSLTKDLNDLAARSAGFASVVNLGTTPTRFGGRAIRMLRLGKDFRDDKPRAMITGGLHAREWISPTFVYLIAEWLIDNRGRNRIADEILNNVHLFIVPMVNPDGHEYTVTTDRDFRKNSPAGDGTFKTAPGAAPAGRQRGALESVDLNRNFSTPNRAAVIASGLGQFSTDPIDEDFVGTRKAFETRTMERFIGANDLDLFIDFHAYGCFFLHSPGDDVRPLSVIDPTASPRYDIFTARVKALLDKSAAANPTTRPGVADTWTIGQASLFYQAYRASLGAPPITAAESLVPGCIDDFAFYRPRGRVPAGFIPKMRTLAYAFELPPVSSESHIGFELPETAIRAVFRMCLGPTLAMVRFCRIATPVPAVFTPFESIP